jgi:hypothetical protein
MFSIEIGVEAFGAGAASYCGSDANKMMQLWLCNIGFINA